MRMTSLHVCHWLVWRVNYAMQLLMRNSEAENGSLLDLSSRRNMNVYAMEERLRALKVRYFAHYIAHSICSASCKAVTKLNQNPAATIVVGNMIPFDMYDEWIQHGQNAMVTVAQILHEYADQHNTVMQNVMAEKDALTEELERLESERYVSRRLARRARLARRTEQ